jgi:hypothetical protein
MLAIQRVTQVRFNFAKESVDRMTSHPCGSFLKLLILWPATGA